MNDLVSVIITTYNSSKTIKNAIVSVVNQSYKNIEILVYDDCSSDNTRKIVEDCFENLDVNCVIKNAEDNFGGPARGRNWGCSISKGKYICFLDADDYWKETKIEHQLKLMGNKGVDVSSTNSTVIGGEQFKTVSGNVSIYNLLKRNKLILSSVMIRKEVLNSLNYIFNEDEKFISVEDYDLFLRLAILKFKIFVLPDKMIYYKILQNSLSHKDFKENENKRLFVLKKLKVTNVLQYIWKWIVILAYKFKF